MALVKKYVQGELIKSADHNETQKNGAIFSKPVYSVVSGASVYTLSDFTMEQEIFEGLKLKLYIDTNSLGSQLSIKIGDVNYPITASFKADNIYNLVYLNNQFVVEKAGGGGQTIRVVVKKLLEFGVEIYEIQNFDGITDMPIDDDLKIKFIVPSKNEYDNPKIRLNNVDYTLMRGSDSGLVQLKANDLQANSVCNIIFNNLSFIIENGSLKATEIDGGLITLNQVYDAGLPFRGVLPYENTILTYQQTMDLKDGIYSIEGIKNFNCLNIPPIGAKGINNFGILKKKTTQVISSSAQAKFQTTLEYIPHNYNFGVSSVTMHFWDKASELNKNLNTSYDASGLWNVSVGWSTFNFSNPGYAKMANGLTIQWGVTAGSTSTADYKYFPIAFDNAVLTGIASYGIFGASGTGSAFEAVDKFKFLATHRNGSSVAVTGSVNWVAIGF